MSTKRRTITPQGYYMNKKGEQVHYQSSYEHRFMEYLDNNDFEWKRCTDRFPYLDAEGKKHNYIPDFYLPEFDLYVEVKGMIRKNDPLKFEAFPYYKNIVLLQAEDLKKLGLKVFDPENSSAANNTWPRKILEQIDDYSEKGELSESLKARLYRFKCVFNLED